MATQDTVFYIFDTTLVLLPPTLAEEVILSSCVCVCLSFCLSWPKGCCWLLCASKYPLIGYFLLFAIACMLARVCVQKWGCWLNNPIKKQTHPDKKSVWINIRPPESSDIHLVAISCQTYSDTDRLWKSVVGHRSNPQSKYPAKRLMWCREFIKQLEAV